MDNPIKVSLSILPHEKLIEILLALDDLEDIFKACSSSTIFARVCQDDYFWKRRYQQDFGSGRPSEGTTWKEFYQSTIEMSRFPPLSVGYNHVGIIDRKGQLYMWGNNEEGQLGNGSKISTNVPQMVLQNVHQVSCGYGATGAVTKNGQVYTWGSNFRGSLGMGYYDEDNEDPDTSVPMLVKLSKKVRKIDYSSSSSIVLTEDGEVYMWGQLTHHLYTEDPLQLNLPSGDDEVISVSTGDFSFAAITKSGKLYMWGDNRHYLYLSKNWTNTSTGRYDLTNPNHGKLIQPRLNLFFEPIRQISMGDNHLGIVTKKGELWMAGSNDFGQIGDQGAGHIVDGYKMLVKNSVRMGVGFMQELEKTIPVLIPIKMPSPVLFFNSRWYTSLVKLKDGRVLMWGNNDNGQIDIFRRKRRTRGTVEISIGGNEFTKPVDITINYPIIYIAAGGIFTVAITGDGYVNFWGDDLALSNL